jgi:hypothetical protein
MLSVHGAQYYCEYLRNNIMQLVVRYEQYMCVRVWNNLYCDGIELFN